MDKIEVTQADQLLVADVLDEISSLLDHNGIGQIADLIRDGEYDGHECVQIAARHRTNRTDATPVAEAWAGMEAAMQDPDYAWGWHCNLAVPIMDATGITHEQANMAAAHLMQHLWKCDITTHPNYQYEKSGAQSYAEFRIEVDEAEDALTAAPYATHPPATDVAALVEAAKALAGTLNRDTFCDPRAMDKFSAALAPFTKGQP